MITYKDSGVDIDAKSRAFALMKAAVESTYSSAVLGGMGTFGGLYDAAALQGMRNPVLVASTDGVGTKVKVAAAMGRFDSIGADLVHHCVNDILVQGGRPLFFLDYIASSNLIPERIAAIVTGLADACRNIGCVLLGGETAEMPGVYAEGEFDLAGTIVGALERDRRVLGEGVWAGDVVIGLGSNGLHTNGYSLARRVLAGLDWSAPHPALDGRSPGDALLDVHTCYLPVVERVWGAGVDVRGMAHITGGGFSDNIPRSLPAGLGVRLDSSVWPIPPIFELIRQTASIPRADLYRTFNMGIGFVLIVAPGDAARALAAVGSGAYRIGEVVAWDGKAPRVRIE